MTTPSAPGRNRPTALDVARLAGVSRTTVSFVLNGRAEERGITEATVQRVVQAAHDLGYLPDRAATMLRSGRSDLVLFAAPPVTDLGPSALTLISAVGDLLEDADLHLVTRKAVPGRPLHVLWRGLSPAAVLALEASEQDLADLAAAGVPAINLDTADFDLAVGSMQAAHLLARGHRSLGYALSTSPRYATYSQRRLASVRQVCRGAGAPDPVQVSLGIDLASALDAVRALQAHPAVTGVCAYDDDHAFALLAAMAQLGLRAPGDLAVIGADNTPLSAVAVPALTTVDQDVKTTAEFLVALLLSAVHGTDGPDLYSGPRPHVVVRATA